MAPAAYAFRHYWTYAFNKTGWVGSESGKNGAIGDLPFDRH